MRKFMAASEYVENKLHTNARDIANREGAFERACGGVPKKGITVKTTRLPAPKLK
jgi:hypothetical protein